MKRLALHQLLGVTFPILLGILITRLLLADVSLEYINAYALVLALLPLASLLELGQDYHLITNISKTCTSCTSYILNAFWVCLFLNALILSGLGLASYTFFSQSVMHGFIIFLIPIIVLARLLSMCESLFKAFGFYKRAAVTRNIVPSITGLLIVVLYVSRTQAIFYYPLVLAGLSLSFVVVIYYVIRLSPSWRPNVFSFFNLLSHPAVPIKSIFGSSFTPTTCISYSLIAILVNIYLQAPRLSLLEAAPSLVGLYVILQSMTSKIHLISAALGEFTLNSTTRQSFLNLISRFSTSYQKLKLPLLALLSFCLYILIPGSNKVPTFFPVILILSYSSVVSSESIFYFYNNVVEGRPSANLYPQFAATLISGLIAAFVYIIHQYLFVPPSIVLLSIASAVLFSQIVMRSLYRQLSASN